MTEGFETYQADYEGRNGRISTEYTCRSVDELVEWLEEEFSEELGGERIDRDMLAVQAVGD